MANQAAKMSDDASWEAASKFQLFLFQELANCDQRLRNLEEQCWLITVPRRHLPGD
jgi:hypothetical protein